MRTEELILYRNFDEGDLLADMVSLMEKFDRTGEVDEGMGADLYRCIHRLLEMAGRFGFTGNLWHCYLTDLLVNNENSYSHACEINKHKMIIRTARNELTSFFKKLLCKSLSILYNLLSILFKFRL